MEKCCDMNPNPHANSGQEIRHLNNYQGYFPRPDGDVQVSCVANSIKEAAKILTLPGVMGEEQEEPTVIKYIKGRVAVSVPIHNIGFTTYVSPQVASESGAFATPVHAEVGNGTEVIFTAADIFGWNFEGWYKGADADGGGQLISTDRVQTIDVYDPYSSMISYYAQYSFSNEIRPGRYMDLNKGYLFDIVFFDSPSKIYDGTVHFNKNTAISDYYFVIPLDTWGTPTAQLVLEKDPRRPNQPSPAGEGVFGFTFGVEATAIGMKLTVVNASFENDWSFQIGDVLQLKWLQD